MMFVRLMILCLSLSAFADEAEWRSLNPNDTVYLRLADGMIVIELNDRFAPKTAAQFRKLVRDGFYDGLSFYRVIDGFVAQGGDAAEESQHPNLPAEFERSWSEQLNYVAAQHGDLFAHETGFIDGFPVGRDAAAEKVWLTHCPGAVAMARANEPDSGTTDFYIVIGQAPRYLDRNLTVFGRVVKGMDVAQRIQRGPAGENGIIEDENQRSRILSARLAADLPEDQRQPMQLVNTNSQAFKDTLASRRNRSHEFFHHKPPKVLDVCQVPIGRSLAPASFVAVKRVQVESDVLNGACWPASLPLAKPPAKSPAPSHLHQVTCAVVSLSVS